MKALIHRLLCAIGLHGWSYGDDEYGRRWAECDRCARIEAD